MLPEKELIARLRPLLPRLGDDTAILASPATGTLLATCDMLVEGIHFDWRFTEPQELGEKAIAVNVSDVAAMGGEPLYALVSLGLTGTETWDLVKSLYGGMLAACRQYGLELVGGDTVRCPHHMVIDVALLGKAEHPVRRAGARPGDLLAVTGELGLARAGLEYLRRHGRAGAMTHPPTAHPPAAHPPAVHTAAAQPPGLHQAVERALAAHLRPQAAMSASRAAVTSRAVTAMIDVSDGLASEVWHLVEESDVAARIHAARVPCSTAARVTAFLDPGADATEVARAWAFHGGEDYQLLMAVDPARLASLAAALQEQGTPLSVIGEFTVPGQEVLLTTPDGHTTSLPRGGYDHFR